MYDNLENNLELGLTKYFPNYGEEISLLLSEDQNFKELADDYLLCIYELKHRIASGNEKLIKQYQETLQDLEEEILSYLHSSKKYTKKS